MHIKDIFNKFHSLFNANKIELLVDSKVFCMAPWIQLHAQTNGKVAPCCMSNVHGGNELGDLRENPRIEDSWNSDNMKQLRKNMLSGEKNSICSHCYNYEAIGKESERMKYNRDYKNNFKTIKKTNEDGSLNELNIPLLDIRFNNKCNYKCRICDSVYSSQWYEDELKIGKIPSLPSTKEMKVSYDETAFWGSYKRILNGVKRLHFAGGEPLVMEDHYQTLEYLIEKRTTDITLSYNTNLSTLKYKQYDAVQLWNHFRKVDVWASLDGMGVQGDYQRKGQRWQKIEENIRRLQVECPTVLFGVNVTVSIFNILHIPDFYKYMVENNFVATDRMNLYLLFDPSYFNITNLTPKLKETVLEDYEKFKKNYLTSLPNNSNIINHVDAVLNFMMSAHCIEQKDFAHWVKTVDGLRSESFEEVFPELSDMLTESN
jgi:MoaA/NifB/PqqE/SkfB family radical SAM enzyme